MKNIVAFGASSSKTSINKELASYAASLVPKSYAIIIDLIDYEMPIYSIDRDKESGIIISFAEHNGVYTAAFKNIFDWISRVEKVVWYNKPMFLLATSDGSRGAKLVLEIAHTRISRGNPYEIPTFSLPNFYENFNKDKGILDEKLKIKFMQGLEKFILNVYGS